MSDCTVAKEEPRFLVKQLGVQSDVARGHESLLALHCYFQHHPVEQRDKGVLQL